MYKPSDKNVNNENSTETPSSTTSGRGLKTMALNDTKAGMEGLDVQRINQVIEEASKGSKFYIHQQNQQDKLNARMQSIQESFKNLSEEQILHSTLTVGLKFQFHKNFRLIKFNLTTRWTKWQRNWNFKESWIVPLFMLIWTRTMQQ